MGITIACTISFLRRISAILYILENGLFTYIVVNILQDNDIIIIIIIISQHSNPSTGLFGSRGSQEVEAPRFQDNRHTTVVRLAVLGTGPLYPFTAFVAAATTVIVVVSGAGGDFCGSIFCLKCVFS